MREVVHPLERIATQCEFALQIQLYISNIKDFANQDIFSASNSIASDAVHELLLGTSCKSCGVAPLNC